MINSLSAVEQALLSMLLAGDHPALVILREQLQNAIVTNRNLTGVGFFTYFAVTPGGSILPVQRWVIGDVGFELDGLEHGGGALLFVRDGVLRTLEAFTNAGEPWPREPAGIAAYYTARGRKFGSAVELVPVDSRDITGLADAYRTIAENPRRGRRSPL